MDPLFDHKLHTFESGLRLVTVPMQGTKSVTVLVLVGTGSKYETKDINGISHFLEHMMFKGTVKRPGYMDISRELESIGSVFNAFTGKEYTGYYAKASSDKTDVIMDVIFDIFLNSKLDESAIQTERHVVVEEINMANDEPAHIVAEHFEKLLYGDQPAGWGIAGEKETILSLKRHQFVDYFNSHYIAGNTVVVIAGDIEHEAVQKKVSEYFAHIRQGEKFGKPKTVEQQSAPALDLFYKATDQTHMILGFRGYDMHDDRRYPLAVLANILGGGMSSRLFDEIREKRGLAYQVSAGVEAYTDSGYFDVYAGVNNGKATEALAVILDEIKKIRDVGVSEQELQRAKDQTDGRVALSLEHSDYIAQIYAESVLFKDKVLTPLERLAKIKSVTRDDLMKVAAEVFIDNRLNLAIVGPFKEAEQFRKLLTVS